MAHFEQNVATFMTLTTMMALSGKLPLQRPPGVVWLYLSVCRDFVRTTDVTIVTSLTSRDDRDHRHGRDCRDSCRFCFRHSVTAISVTLLLRAHCHSITFCELPTVPGRCHSRELGTWAVAVVCRVFGVFGGVGGLSGGCLGSREPESI